MTNSGVQAVTRRVGHRRTVLWWNELPFRRDAVCWYAIRSVAARLPYRVSISGRAIWLRTRRL